MAGKDWMASSTLWGMPKNITRVQEYIPKGFRCKTGCQTRRCKCQRHEPPVKRGPAWMSCTAKEQLDEHQPVEHVEGSDE